MTLSPCLEPGCPDFAQVRGRCRRHASEQDRRQRSPFHSFYRSKPWLLTRHKQLFDHPLCEHIEDGEPCGELATIVHHMIDLNDGGAKRDPANLQSLCKSHHDSITRARQLRGRVAA